MFGDRALNAAADEALTNAMYRFTFGIIGDARGGREGRGIGTGIGVWWNGTFLVLTAAHTMQTTPDERQYFLLPGEGLTIQESTIPAAPPTANVNRRVQLTSQQTVLDDECDLAAFILPEQTEAKQHFYLLDRAHTPAAGAQVGVLGYPEATCLPAGAAFMATPYSTFGSIVAPPADCNAEIQFAVTYPTTSSVDAHGLSGAGIWLAESPTKLVWVATIRLVGLVTHVDPNRQILLGLKVEELARFFADQLP